MVNRVITNAAPPTRVEVLRPRKYRGKRDAQELENFLWYMEMYFEATSVQSEQERVNIATEYLEDHAITWWQRKYVEIVQGMCIINTWDLLKCEIKKQFYPGNGKYEAWKKMGSNLGHKGSFKGVKLSTSPPLSPKPTPLLNFTRANHPSRRKMASPITAKVGEGREINHLTTKKGRQIAS
ncbi:hypothetical protein Patl1_33542 [Pistacia atlantica]|uniref:Uncharacterized protein n=1 Tax=Pistacia atlantica TaxID=434234 RepID=A0ACC0ZSB0_9ROSI|nr:hypothetical protein Patl1_33542 [Pistacia atlantica]